MTTRFLRLTPKPGGLPWADSAGKARTAWVNPAHIVLFVPDGDGTTLVANAPAGMQQPGIVQVTESPAEVLRQLAGESAP